MQTEIYMKEIGQMIWLMGKEHTHILVIINKIRGGAKYVGEWLNDLQHG